jgi:hypothetical protein
MMNMKRNSIKAILMYYLGFVWRDRKGNTKSLSYNSQSLGRSLVKISVSHPVSIGAREAEHSQQPKFAFNHIRKISKYYERHFNYQINTNLSKGNRTSSRSKMTVLNSC